MSNIDEFIAYLEARKSKPKTNYHLEALKEIQSFEGRKPRILLHVCCVICACWPIEFLKEYFDVSLIYNNSNIYPSEEYTKRLNELKRYLKERYNDSIPLIEAPYDNETYTKDLEIYKDDPEGFRRCFLCYEKRLEEAYAYAEENGFDYFTTVMTFSRQKDSQKINEIGKALMQKYPNTKYFFSDFKKDNGQLKSNEIAEEYCLYKQNYCGCIYSLPNDDLNK